MCNAEVLGEESVHGILLVAQIEVIQDLRGILWWEVAVRVFEDFSHLVDVGSELFCGQFGCHV